MALRRMNEGNIDQGFVNAAPIPSSPASIAERVDQGNARGVPTMIGDVSMPMANLTEWSSRGSGPAQTMVRERLQARQAEAGNRVQQHVRDTFETTASPRGFLSDLEDQTRRAAGPAYEEAYAQPMQLSREIQGYMETPAFQSALPNAYTNIRNQIDPETLRPKSPEAMGMRHVWRTPEGSQVPAPALSPSQHPQYFQHPEMGHVAVGNDLSVEGFDQVIRSMRGRARAGMEVHPLTGERKDTTDTVHVNRAASNLRGLLMDQNEPYRRAVTEYGDNVSRQEAFENGMAFGAPSITGDDLMAAHRDMPEQAARPWEVGAGTSMMNAAGRYASDNGQGNVANYVRKMMGDANKQDAIGQITGNTGQVRELQERLAAEMQAHRTYRAAEMGSQTAPRQAIDADVDEAAGFGLRSGSTAGRIIDMVTSRTAPAYRQQVKDRIGQIVTASGAKDVSEVMEALERQARQDEEFASLLGRSGLAASNLYARNIAPTDSADDNYE